jgi:hypothetical protein
VVVGTGAGRSPDPGPPGGGRLQRRRAGGRGGPWDPRADFATDEEAQSKLFWMDERLSAGADPLIFGSNNSGIGVGRLHPALTPPTSRGPQADDFRLHSESGVRRRLGRSPIRRSRPTTPSSRPIWASPDRRITPGGPREATPLPALPLNAPGSAHAARAATTLGIRPRPRRTRRPPSPSFRRATACAPPAPTAASARPAAARAPRPAWT